MMDMVNGLVLRDYLNFCFAFLIFHFVHLFKDKATSSPPQSIGNMNLLVAGIVIMSFRMLGYQTNAMLVMHYRLILV